MEADHHGKSIDKKLSILDMDVWLDGEVFVVSFYLRPVPGIVALPFPLPDLLSHLGVDSVSLGSTDPLHA